MTSINTLGLSEGASFADLQQVYSLYDLPTLSVNGPRRPWQIPSAVYTQNDEQVLGGMGLIKLGAGEVIKLRTTYTRDTFSFAGSEDIRFDLPDVPTLTQHYIYQNELSPVSWSSHAIYEKNGDHLFIKSKNVINTSHNTDLGKNTYNGTPITENLLNKTVEGKSANEIIFRLPNQALSVYVDLLYKNLNESLDVDTLDLAIDNINKGFSELNQTMDRSIVQGHIWTGFHWKTNKGILVAKNRDRKYN